MAVAGMIRNYERESVVDFTASFMDYGVGILVRKPSRTTSAFGFLEPFTVQVGANIFGFMQTLLQSTFYSYQKSALQSACKWDPLQIINRFQIQKLGRKTTIMMNKS